MNISPDIPGDQQDAIMAAFDNWMNALPESNVTFHFTSDPVTVTGPGTMQVERGTVPGNSIAHTSVLSSSQGVDSASTTYDSRITNDLALTQTMAHEIGHTFGLDDCGSCGPQQSVMVGAPDYNDTAWGTTGPTACDAASARQVAGYASGPGAGPPPGSGGTGGQCTSCTVRVCHRREDGTQDCNIVVGYCCPKGFISAEDWETTPTCGYLNFWGPEQYDECSLACDDTCRKKQYCGDLPCEPWPHYCWKCLDASSSDSGDPPPTGSTCDEMGWFAADQKSACDSICGGPDTCGKKQWCGSGTCQPWPNYCWKCN